MNTVAPVLAVVVLAAACGSSGDDAEADGPDASVDVESVATGPPSSSSPPAASVVEANGETVDVVALDNTFRPERIEVVAGTAIRWENRGRNDHDVLPADDTLTWGVDAAGFAPGDEYTLLFDTPGEYPYFCSIHGTKDVGMIGTVVVVAADD